MQKVVDLLVRKLSPAQLAGIFLLLVVPMVFAPFFSDDYFHLLMLGDNPPLPYPHDGSFRGLFSFIDNDPPSRLYLMQQGVLPWWTGGNFYFKFWRPLAELSHWLDFRVAPYSALFAHLHSIGWFLLLSFAVLALYRNLAGSFPLALLAFALFLLDGNHAPVIEWVANRNALISAFLAVLVLLFHHRFRCDGGLFWLPLAVMALVGGLLAGEAALAVGGYLFAYAVFLDRGGFRRGFLALLLYAVVVVIWFFLYKSLGFGANGSSQHYVDIASMPLDFLRAAAERVPVYIASALLLVPAEVYPALVFLGGEEYRWPALLTVLVLLLLIACLLWPLLRQSALLRFSLLGATLSVIPFCAIINQDRVALIPGIGFSLAIAEVILRGFAAGQLLRGFAALLVVLHLMLSPLLLFAESAYISANARHTRANLLQLADSDLDGKRVVLLKGSVSQSALLRPVRRLQGVAEPESVWLLSGGRDLLQITRVGENELLLRREHGFVGWSEQAFRDLEHFPFTVGSVIRLEGIEMTVHTINSAGQPVELLCRFTEGLASGRYFFIASGKGGQLERVAIPANLGETVSL